MIDIDLYLERIGLTSRPSCDEDGLAFLMHAHLHTVPFENLDIPLGNGIHLETDYLIDKIITRRRGGYCFELNGLFGTLLDALGFERFPVMARVWYKNPPEVPPLTHTLNIVTIGGQPFMADVGFGGTTARVPVPIDDNTIAEDVDGRIILQKDQQFGYMLVRETPNGLEKQFSTTLEFAHQSDLFVGNHYVSTHPNSHFTRVAVAGKFTANGRIGVTDNVLSLREGWETTTTTLTSKEAYRSMLRDTFGIDLAEKHVAIIQAFMQD